jgi:hypothetical protein
MSSFARGLHSNATIARLVAPVFESWSFERSALRRIGLNVQLGKSNRCIARHDLCNNCIAIIARCLTPMIDDKPVNCSTINMPSFRLHLLLLRIHKLAIQS